MQLTAEYWASFGHSSPCLLTYILAPRILTQELDKGLGRQEPSAAWATSPFVDSPHNMAIQATTQAGDYSYCLLNLQITS